MVLATIFWNKTEHGSQEGLNRETQLLETEGFWKSMKDVGAEVARLSEDYHGTVPALLRMARQPKIVPNMESELKNGVPLENTMAGLYIHHNRSELEEKYEEEIAEMRFHFNCRMEEQEQQKTEAAARSHELLKAKDDEIAAMRRSVEAMGERLAGLEQSQRSRQADLETELRNIRATEREERQRHISAEERLRNIASQQESKLRYRISFAHHKKVELQLQIFHRACNTGISPIRVPEIAPNGSASRSGRNYWCDFCSTPFGMGLMYCKSSVLIRSYMNQLPSIHRQQISMQALLLNPG